MFCQTSPSVYQLCSWPKKSQRALAASSYWSCRARLPDGIFRARELAAEQSHRRAAVTPIFGRQGRGGRVAEGEVPSPRGARWGADVPRFLTGVERTRLVRNQGGVRAAGAPPFASFLGAESRSPPNSCASSANGTLRAYLGSATTPCTICFNFYLL